MNIKQMHSALDFGFNNMLFSSKKPIDSYLQEYYIDPKLYSGCSWLNNIVISKELIYDFKEIDGCLNDSGQFDKVTFLKNLNQYLHGGCDSTDIFMCAYEPLLMFNDRMYPVQSDFLFALYGYSKKDKDVSVSKANKLLLDESVNGFCECYDFMLPLEFTRIDSEYGTLNDTMLDVSNVDFDNFGDSGYFTEDLKVFKELTIREICFLYNLKSLNKCI